MKTVWIVLIVIAVSTLSSAFGLYSWGVGTYNGMINGQETVDAQWSNVENVYQRRADLIPNLVNVVKGYASHEKETFTAVVEARAKATQTKIDVGNMTPQKMAAFQSAQDGLGSALSKLMVVVERYPDLKANQNFLELQAQLEGTENRIAVERRKYNETARKYNTSIKVFPASFIAGFGNFQQKVYFESAKGSDVAPTVEF